MQRDEMELLYKTQFQDWIYNGRYDINNLYHKVTGHDVDALYEK